MVRQLGMPTFFISKSCADTRWPALLKLFGKLLDNKEYTDQEIDAMSYQDRNRLVSADPVTCVRYFEYRSSQFQRYILDQDLDGRGCTKDNFIRREFQQRGILYLNITSPRKYLPYN